MHPIRLAMNMCCHGGLLREPLSGLQRADIIVLTKVDQVAPGIVSGIRKRLTQMIPNIPVYETTHKPQFMYTLDEWANVLWGFCRCLQGTNALWL